MSEFSFVAFNFNKLFHVHSCVDVSYVSYLDNDCEKPVLRKVSISLLIMGNICVGICSVSRYLHYCY